MPSNPAEMFDVAKKTGKLLVEAFIPQQPPDTCGGRRRQKRSVIGDLRLIRTSFCYRTTKIAGNVRFDRELAGGV